MCGAPWVLSVDEIGADALDLIENVLTAGHADGDHQDQGCGSDHHSQRSEDEAHLVAAESVVGETHDFAQGHFGPKALGDQGSSHVS